LEKKQDVEEERKLGYITYKKKSITPERNYSRFGHQRDIENMSK
jgi:hypothetical protein